MSEKATNRTQELFTEILPKTIVENAGDRWDACVELSAKVNELQAQDTVDEQAVIEIATANADKHGIESGIAKRVLHTTRRMSGGLFAMHAPSRMVWQGTGSSITTVGMDVVDYLNIPGMVEAKYGSAFPYIVTKLGWAAALAAEGIEYQDNVGGYQRVTAELRQRGKLAADSLQHLGSVARFGELQVNNGNVEAPFYLASASGTLMNEWANKEYHSLPGYKNREAIDEAAGLLDNFPQNLRAGLYDVQFAEMTIEELLGKSYDGSVLQVFHPQYYEGVDIN